MSIHARTLTLLPLLATLTPVVRAADPVGATPFSFADPASASAPSSFERHFGSATPDGSDDDSHGSNWTASRPDSHAPIGVMGDHVHGQGEWMVSLRWMRMSMSGLQEGTSDISTQDVFDQGYMVSPTDMQTDMLMAGFMYAPSNELTLTAMLPWVDKSMNHVTGMGGTFETTASGFGDMKLGGLYQVIDRPGLRGHFNFALSVPTGSVTETGLPGNPSAHLPYPMQLGSGTFDIIPGFTILGQFPKWSWGAQALYTARLGRNSEEYSLGNQTELNAWGARSIIESLSGSLRMRYFDRGNINGADPLIPTTPNPPGYPVPTANPDAQGRSELDVGIGLNWYFGDGALKNNRLGVEYILPLYQDVDGPQLSTDWMFVIGWQYSS